MVMTMIEIIGGGRLVLVLMLMLGVTTGRECSGHSLGRDPRRGWSGASKNCVDVWRIEIGLGWADPDPRRRRGIHG